MLEYDLIPGEVLNAVKKSGFDKSIIEDSTPEELFAIYCEWNGLLGWSSSLIRNLDGLRKAKMAD